MRAGSDKRDGQSSEGDANWTGGLDERGQDWTFGSLVVILTVKFVISVTRPIDPEIPQPGVGAACTKPVKSSLGFFASALGRPSMDREGRVLGIPRTKISKSRPFSPLRGQRMGFCLDTDTTAWHFLLAGGRRWRRRTGCGD